MATITETQTLGAEFPMDKTTIDLVALRKSFMQPITKFLKPKEVEAKITEGKLTETKECTIPDCTCKTIVVCPPDCPCRQQSSSYRTMNVVINALGILLAILATYMIVSTDSKLYLVFWISYSILRRMMTKSRKHLKSD